jgi:hypothetical protein
VLNVELPLIPSSWSQDEEDLIAVGWEADDQGKKIGNIGTIRHQRLILQAAKLSQSNGRTNMHFLS